MGARVYIIEELDPRLYLSMRPIINCDQQVVLALLPHTSTRPQACIIYMISQWSVVFSILFTNVGSGFIDL